MGPSQTPPCSPGLGLLLQAHFGGSPSAPETDLEPQKARRAPSHVLLDFKRSAPPWGQDGVTGHLLGDGGPHTHHPQAESLLLRLLLLPPPLPGVTAVAPPLTSLARTAEKQSSGMGRGSAPLYLKCASAPKRPPIAHADLGVAGGPGGRLSGRCKTAHVAGGSPRPVIGREGGA